MKAATTHSHSRNSKPGIPASASFALQGSFVVLFVAASAANAMAFYVALNQPWLAKLGPILTLGGFLVLAPIEWILRILIASAIGWSILTHRGRRNLIEWIALGLGAVAVVAGWGTLVSHSALACSLAVWLLFQAVQYKSIEDGASPGLRTIALAMYVAEFAFQCIATPISPDPPLMLATRFLTGTLQWHSIYWGRLLINIGCMAGVEWLGRLYILCMRKIR